MSVIIFIRSYVRPPLQVCLFVHMYDPPFKFVCSFVCTFPPLKVNLSRNLRIIYIKNPSCSSVLQLFVSPNSDMGISGSCVLGKMGFWKHDFRIGDFRKMISGNGIFGKMVFWENRILGKCDFGKRGFLSIGIWDFGKMRFWENGMVVFWENGILGNGFLGKWDN